MSSLAATSSTASTASGEVPGVTPTARLDAVGGKPVWLYRAPLKGAPAVSVR